MREIKFRGWDKERKEWLWNFDVCKDGRVLATGYNRFASTDEIRKDITLDVELTQYTGVKDKNGKDIYEGDIAKDSLGNIGIVEYKSTLLVIKYGEGSQYYPVENFINNVNDTTKSSLEVVGNIYENTELLK